MIESSTHEFLLAGKNYGYHTHLFFLNLTLKIKENQVETHGKFKLDKEII